jgi:hypothetical protein
MRMYRRVRASSNHRRAEAMRRGSRTASAVGEGQGDSYHGAPVPHDKVRSPSSPESDVPALPSSVRLGVA